VGAAGAGGGGGALSTRSADPAALSSRPALIRVPGSVLTGVSKALAASTSLRSPKMVMRLST